MALTKLNPNWPAMDVMYPNRLGRLLEEVLGAPFAREENMLGAWMPPVDVIEEKEFIRIVAEVPGVLPEDVKISLENNLLTIRGEKKKEEEAKDAKVHRFERTWGMFERSFTLPSTIDADRIVARYDGGVLTIQLPKVEAAKPRQISVKIAK